MSGRAELSSTLRRIDRRGYRAYKDIEGTYDLGDLVLAIDHVQGDPFAAPSKVRVRVPMRVAALPVELFDNPIRKLAFSDYLARAVRRALYELTEGHRGSGKSGQMDIDAGGQEVLERTAVVLTDAFVEARLSVGLPAAGRSVLGREAEAMLLDELPRVARDALTREGLDYADALAFVDCVENQDHLRRVVEREGLVAFVADGAVLPRASGASDRPLGRGAVAWTSPESMAMQVDLPRPLPDGARRLRGTAVRRGVTVIVGGGYHGKSTLLKALERGVYFHVPGDGREYVVTDPRAVKIRAEDGRAVTGVDISPFIDNLPHGRSTVAFSSEDASGSTSQAANIMEALEVGATALLLDEDTSATNFMVRDARMQALVHKSHEPITPFVDRVRELHDTLQISTVLVMGGSGDYFDAADQVILMREFVPSDATAEAKEVAAAHPTTRRTEAARPLTAPRPRVPSPSSLDASRGRRDVKIDARGTEQIAFGTHTIDLRQVEQLVDGSQTRAVGAALELAKRFMDGRRDLLGILDALERYLDTEGLDHLDPYHRAGRHPGNYARPRRFEIAAAMNRLRALRLVD
ncbi:MAG: ABC-ATPase domain-containing protein [Deltaproteobacteria bacterium]|nr:ABC-ATPase domain-containing protein [Deltaproteobacteria bacterium]